MSNSELRSILGAAAAQRSGLDETIQQLIFIIEKQNENIVCMEQEIAALRRHVADMAGDILMICPVIGEARREENLERAREIVRRYYADIKRSNDGRGKEN